MPLPLSCIYFSELRCSVINAGLSFIIAHCIRLTFVPILLSAITLAIPLGEMPSNTVILLIPGAFHTESAMDLLSGQLQQAGYSTHAMGLVTVNNAQLSIKDDIAAIRSELLDPLVEQQGRDVVLYLHSYAGFPGSTVIEGLSKAERTAKGQAGGIIGLIYQSAFTPKEGDTLLQLIGGSYPPWQDPNVCGYLSKSVGLGTNNGAGEKWSYHRDKPKANVLR